MTADWSKLFDLEWEPSEADWRELETGAPRCTGMTRRAIASQFGPEIAHSLMICDPRSGISDFQIRKRLREWLTQPKPQPKNYHG